MALILLLARNQYHEGIVTRYIGDRWTLDAQVVDRVGGVDTPKALGDSAGATAYFPTSATAATGIEATVSVQEEGRLSIEVTEDVTAELYESPNGIPVWVELDNLTTPQGPIHVRTPNPDLAIKDARDFQDE